MAITRAKLNVYRTRLERLLSCCTPTSFTDLVDGFTRRTFTAMIEGVREPAIAAGLINPESFEAGVRHLHRTTEKDGVFCYTFCKGWGRRVNSMGLDRP